MPKLQKLSKLRSGSIVPLLFILFSIIGLWASGLSVHFVANEVMNRFVRNGVMILALIIPVKAGMGINFSVTVGAMCAQAAYIGVIAMNVDRWKGLCVLLVALTLASAAGYVIGRVLNHVKGKEMITTIIIGFLANSVYQLVFLVCVGGLFTLPNREILLSRGIGVRNLIDLDGFRGALDQVMAMDIMGIHMPFFMIGVVVAVGGVLNYLIKTPFGQEIRCVGMDFKKSHQVGINNEKVRIKVMMLSTMLAALGHLIYLQNIGMLNVYTGHLKHEVFASAALLAGGATIKDAKIKHAFMGLVLFHTLFIVSPQAGQELFNNPALGEYFRSFVAYGTIAFALIMNLKENTSTTVWATDKLR